MTNKPQEIACRIGKYETAGRTIRDEKSGDRRNGLDAPAWVLGLARAAPPLDGIHSRTNHRRNGKRKERAPSQ